MKGQNSNQETASMEQVRDLLFGNQLKDIESRFSRQDEKFAMELADLQENMKKRLDTLENFMKSETGSLLHRITTSVTGMETAIKEERKEREEATGREEEERNSNLSKLALEIAESEERIDRRLSTLSNTVDKIEKDIKELLLKESNSLNSKVEEKYLDAIKALRQAEEGVRADMVYRSGLSSLFAGMAMGLGGKLEDESSKSNGSNK